MITITPFSSDDYWKRRVEYNTCDINMLPKSKKSKKNNILFDYAYR